MTRPKLVEDWFPGAVSLTCGELYVCRASYSPKARLWTILPGPGVLEDTGWPTPEPMRLVDVMRWARAAARKLKVQK